MKVINARRGILDDDELVENDLVVTLEEVECDSSNYIIGKYKLGKVSSNLEDKNIVNVIFNSNSKEVYQAFERQKLVKMSTMQHIINEWDSIKSVISTLKKFEAVEHMVMLLTGLVICTSIIMQIKHTTGEAAFVYVIACVGLVILPGWIVQASAWIYERGKKEKNECLRVVLDELLESHMRGCFQIAPDEKEFVMLDKFIRNNKNQS